ncbi:MAG TPA: metallophosphoesterase family protein [Anaerolineae bacterium]|nr:metallophosphoesterase family protein [Anaerolineae bacterium]
MKLGLIADIHGNSTALTAVLAALQAEAVDHIICLGDVATLGAQPAQAVDLLIQHNIPLVQGNHEAALFNLNNTVAYSLAPQFRPMLEWCYQQLSPVQLDYLANAPQTISPHPNILCYHGSPHSNIQGILPTTTLAQLDIIFPAPRPTILIGAHTHYQMLRPFDGSLIINPGSVGVPFRHPPQPGVTPQLLPWAEYAILTHTPNHTHVDLRRLRYPLPAYHQAILATNYPDKTWLANQYNLI